MKYNLQQGKLKLQGLISSNNISKAIKLSKSLIKNNPDIDLLLTHAQLQLLNNDLKGCEITRKIISKKHHNDKSAHRVLANLFKEHGQYQVAIKEYEIALDNVPNDKSLYDELAALYIHTKQYNNAISLLESAIKQYPDNSRFFLMLGASHQSLQDIDNAQLCYEKAHQLSSNNTDAIVGIANIQYLRKSYKESLETLKPVLDMDPCPFPALILYSQLADINNCQESAINKLINTPDNSISPIHQSMKYFSLGRLNDEMTNYAIAFDYYTKANNLNQNNYNTQVHDEYFSAISRCYTRDTINTLKRTATDSKRLVFIVGMPRSGTSLLEQILASHPDVHGCGELNTLGDIIKRLPEKHKLVTSFPDFIDELNASSIEDSAHEYIKYIELLDQTSQLVTDKMPDNFLYLGLINILFPQAIIIHCTRNAYDTCLSCYFQQFSGHYPYAYQLDNLAHYYNAYQKLMLHWRDNLTTTIFDFNYEALIKDKENTIRKLLKHCNLDWHENCLEFNKSSRAITTASTQQVSKALYNTSIERWRNYKPQLDILIKNIKLQ